MSTIFSFPLAINLALRFLAGGPSTEGFMAIVSQGTWMFFVLWLAFTSKGRRAGEHLLNELQVSGYWLDEIICVVGIGVCAMLLALYSYLPQLAGYYYNSGLREYQHGQLSEAQKALKMSIALNPDHSGARYVLGKLYENQNRSDLARQEYQTATQNGYVKAFTPLARLYILDGKPDVAVQLLQQGLHQIEQEKTDELTLLKYDLYTNLGWARLEQKRYNEAETHLVEALELAKSLKESEMQATPHCLLAQVLDPEATLDKRREPDDTLSKQREPKDTLNKRRVPIERVRNEWKYCLRYASPTNPDEDRWIGLAKQRLQDW